MSKMTPDEKRDFKNAQRQANAIETAVSYDFASNYGLCSGCTYFVYREYEHGHKSVSICSHHNSDGIQRLHSSHRITKCSDYMKRGQLSLEAMWTIGKHIEIKHDKPIGFKLSEADEDELEYIGDIYD